jgi:NADH-quinone oxidoreductase subunit E
VADMLDMAHIRVLEVATFYFMFQLKPVGSLAHIQVCGTTSCMICGAEDLIGVCRDKIADKPHQLSDDGRFSWEEVECLGSCSNAPMAQIGKDYYEDLTADRLGEILDELALGKVPVPGPQNGRYGAEPQAGLTSLSEFDSGRTQYNASVQLAVDMGDTVKRIDGTEVPLLTPWNPEVAAKVAKEAPAKARPAKPARTTEKPVAKKPKPAAHQSGEGDKPEVLSGAREGGADDLKLIKGVGPKLEGVLNGIGIYHFDQIAGWSADHVAWADQNLVGFKGRVSRDAWVEQARALASGEETEFSEKSQKRQE